MKYDGTNGDHAGSLAAAPPVEDVQVAGHRQRDDVLGAAPCVSNLLVGHARPKRPGRDRLSRLDVPCSATVISTDHNRLDGSVQSLTVQSAEDVTREVLSGLQVQAIYAPFCAGVQSLDLV